MRHLAQGHLDTQLGGTGDRTSNLWVTSQPPLPPLPPHTDPVHTGVDRPRCAAGAGAQLAHGPDLHGVLLATLEAVQHTAAVASGAGERGGGAPAQVVRRDAVVHRDGEGRPAH